MEVSPAVTVPGRRLGKLPPKFDPRTLRLASYIEKRKLPRIPSAHTLSHKTVAAFPDLGMMRNDALGDCTVAAIGHAYQTWTVYGGVGPWRPTDDAIVTVYDRVNGGADNGAAMLDVLNTVRDTGIGGRRIYAFVAIDPTNHDQVRTAHFLFGGIYAGASMPRAAQDQAVWDVTTGNGSEPGSWGGHAFYVPDYAKKTNRCVTWGALQSFTWEWWDRYVDEAYAILDADFIGPDHRSPAGISFAALANDLKGL